ncbi:hypothetical protein QOZ28_10615, partial [Pseudomonas aeruginosa]|uniref:hypothetical protein n=1 Tax=Pseudomonas aeruginosa TaxID=287 RepID=UPI00345A7652
RFEYPSRRNTGRDDAFLRHAAESAVIAPNIFAVSPLATMQRPARLLHRHLAGASALPRIGPIRTYPRFAYRSYRHDEC